MAAHSISFDLMTLLDAPGVGPGRVRKALKRCRETLGNGSLLDDPVLRETLTSAQVASLPASRERVARHWEELSRKDVQAISIFDPKYPESLKNLLRDDAPLVLLCMGNLDLLSRKSVGFCGSREATEKGVATAWGSAELLAREGINIVSGFATGVDMNAHRAALASGGTTSVILAEGILRFRIKREIRELWDEERILVVSEFGPNLPWSVSHAMRRNRTICGLSQALILIEARSSGGSIEAGRDCLRLRLPLFAAVYEGMPESATGNEELLRDGANRLMKSRSTGLPNIRPILDAISSNPHSKSPLDNDHANTKSDPQLPLLA